jgi:hypothetical protein
MRLPTRRLTVAVLLALALPAVGCGTKPKLVSVTGKVTHKGNAVVGGSVWFHPAEGNPYQGDKPSGQLQTDGTFTAKTFPHGEGIPPGKYKVTLSPDLAGRIGAPQYGDATKTPWSIDVPDGGLAGHVFEVK